MCITILAVIGTQFAQNGCKVTTFISSGQNKVAFSADFEQDFYINIFSKPILKAVLYRRSFIRAFF